MGASKGWRQYIVCTLGDLGSSVGLLDDHVSTWKPTMDVRGNVKTQRTLYV